MVTSNLLSSLGAVFSMSETSIQEGRKRYLKRTRNLKQKRQESKSQHGRFLYKRYLDQFSTELSRLSKLKARGRASAFAADWKAVQGLNSTIIAHLTLQAILDSLSSETPRNRLAMLIGSRLDDEINLSYLKRRQPKWWKRLEAHKKTRSSYGYKRNLAVRWARKDFGVDWASKVGFWMTPTTKCHLGLTLIELFRTLTGLISYTKKRIGPKKFEIVVLPTPAALEWLNKFHDKVSYLLPFHLPLTSEPLPWTDPHTGGYSYPEAIHWHFIKTDYKTIKDNYNNNNLEKAFRAANVLQRTPYRINEWVLSVVNEGISRGFVFGDCCRYSTEGDLREPVGNTNYTGGYRRSQAKKHKLRRKMMPKYIQSSTVLTLAQNYHQDTLFFPVQADFRGRLYYVPKCLNPQGSDLAKGLLQFANGTSVRESEDWFLVGGGNLYGEKGSLQDRQQWVLDNEGSILQTAVDPFSMSSFWLEADSPLPFLAFCNEYREWRENRFTFTTRLPVRLDHTASGLQIVSLLKGDKELQKLTNLTDPSQPYDVYLVILSNLQHKLATSPRPEDHQWRLDRALIKLLTINFMYGGTTYGLERATVNWYLENHPDVFGRKIYIEIRRLIELYREALSQVSEAPKEFIQETKDTQGETMLSWESPSGFPVVNHYSPQKSVMVKTSVNGERIRGRVNIRDNSAFCKKSARQALPANKVHSYDSGLLHLMLINDEWPDILALHDCYGVPPKDCERLLSNLSEVMGQIYRLDMHPRMCYAVS